MWIAGTQLLCVLVAVSYSEVLSVFTLGLETHPRNQIPSERALETL